MDYKVILMTIISRFNSIEELLKNEVQLLESFDTEKAYDNADYLNELRRELKDINLRLEYYYTDRMSGVLP